MVKRIFYDGFNMLFEHLLDRLIVSEMLIKFIMSEHDFFNNIFLGFIFYFACQLFSIFHNNIFDSLQKEKLKELCVCRSSVFSIITFLYMAPHAALLPFWRFVPFYVLNCECICLFHKLFDEFLFVCFIF